MSPGSLPPHGIAGVYRTLRCFVTSPPQALQSLREQIAKLLWNSSYSGTSELWAAGTCGANTSTSTIHPALERLATLAQGHLLPTLGMDNATRTIEFR